jgi:hypothetical protein
MKTLHLPEVISSYLQEFLCITRYQAGQGPIGPTVENNKFSTPRLKFLGDAAHALHNITLPNGPDHFFRSAQRINAAWERNPESLNLLILQDTCFDVIIHLPEHENDTTKFQRDNRKTR